MDPEFSYKDFAQSEVLWRAKRGVDAKKTILDSLDIDQESISESHQRKLSEYLSNDDPLKPGKLDRVMSAKNIHKGLTEGELIARRSEMIETGFGGATGSGKISSMGVLQQRMSQENILKGKLAKGVPEDIMHGIHLGGSTMPGTEFPLVGKQTVFAQEVMETRSLRKRALSQAHRRESRLLGDAKALAEKVESSLEYLGRDTYRGKERLFVKDELKALQNYVKGLPGVEDALEKEMLDKSKPAHKLLKTKGLGLLKEITKMKTAPGGKFLDMMEYPETWKKVMREFGSIKSTSGESLNLRGGGQYGMFRSFERHVVAPQIGGQSTYWLNILNKKERDGFKNIFGLTGRMPSIIDKDIFTAKGLHFKPQLEDYYSQNEALHGNKYSRRMRSGAKKLMSMYDIDEKKAASLWASFNRRTITQTKGLNIARSVSISGAMSSNLLPTLNAMDPVELRYAKEVRSALKSDPWAVVDPNKSNQQLWNRYKQHQAYKDIIMGKAADEQSAFAKKTPSQQKRYLKDLMSRGISRSDIGLVEKARHVGGTEAAMKILNERMSGFESMLTTYTSGSTDQGRRVGTAFLEDLFQFTDEYEGLNVKARKKAKIKLREFAAQVIEGTDAGKISRLEGEITKLTGTEFWSGEKGFFAMMKKGDVPGTTQSIDSITAGQFSMLEEAGLIDENYKSTGVEGVRPSELRPGVYEQANTPSLEMHKEMEQLRHKRTQTITQGGLLSKQLDDIDKKYVDQGKRSRRTMSQSDLRKQAKLNKRVQINKENVLNIEKKIASAKENMQGVANLFEEQFFKTREFSSPKELGQFVEQGFSGELIAGETGETVRIGNQVGELEKRTKAAARSYVEGRASEKTYTQADIQEIKNRRNRGTTRINQTIKAEAAEKVVEEGTRFESRIAAYADDIAQRWGNLTRGKKLGIAGLGAVVGLSVAGRLINGGTVNTEGLEPPEQAAGAPLPQSMGNDMAMMPDYYRGRNKARVYDPNSPSSQISVSMSNRRPFNTNELIDTIQSGAQTSKYSTSVNVNDGRHSYRDRSFSNSFNGASSF